MENEILELLTIKLNKNDGTYNFKVAPGGNIAECMFAIAAFIRALERDGYIENREWCLNEIKKYLEDEQYDELKEE